MGWLLRENYMIKNKNKFYRHNFKHLKLIAVENAANHHFTHTKCHNYLVLNLVYIHGEATTKIKLYLEQDKMPYTNRMTGYGSYLIC